MKKKLEQLRTKGLIKASVKFEEEGSFSSTAYIEGFDCCINSFAEILKDRRNKYNSFLAGEKTQKLGKTANFERITTYQAYVEIIDELIKDLSDDR